MYVLCPLWPRVVFFPNSVQFFLFVSKACPSQSLTNHSVLVTQNLRFRSTQTHIKQYIQRQGKMPQIQPGLAMRTGNRKCLSESKISLKHTGGCWIAALHHRPFQVLHCQWDLLYWGKPVSFLSSTGASSLLSTWNIANPTILFYYILTN
jgi:hypothetical protein